MSESKPLPGSMLDRLNNVEKDLKKKGSHEGPKKRQITHSKTEAALAAAIHAARRANQDDPALEDFREQLFAELRKLIKPAIAQAKKGKPALLRILTRYTR